VLSVVREAERLGLSPEETDVKVMASAHG
jgi:hypothetical protein